MQDKKTTIQQGFLRPAQAARFVGVCPRTVRQWLHQKRLPFSKLGHRVCLIAKTDIEAFIEANKQEAV